MTNEERMIVDSLRAQGLGYKRIAAQTGISLNTVKSYLKKNTAVGKEQAVSASQPVAADDKSQAVILPKPAKKKAETITPTPVPDGDAQTDLCPSEKKKAETNTPMQAEDTTQTENQQRLCLHCGKPVMQNPGRKEKKFCSDSCRNKWWNSHLDLVKRKAIYQFTCPVCGKTFSAYGDSHRKYCSRACYIESRSIGNRAALGLVM